MARPSEQVLRDALELTPDERAVLAARLLASLEEDSHEDIEAAWAVEIERRARRVLRGEGQFEDWDDIREQLRPKA